MVLTPTGPPRNIIRPDLKIVIMSATIDTENICQTLHAPLIKSDGKLFPIETFYEKVDTDFREIHRKAASVISIAHREHEGDILAFLPQGCWKLRTGFPILIMISL